MKLTLQKLLWPTIGVCTQEVLYFRLERAFSNGGTIELQHGGTAAFTTYFNCFSIDKWREYTVVQSLILRLELKGHFRVRLLAEHLINDGVTTNVLLDQEFNLKEKAWVELPFPADANGLLSFSLLALEPGICYGGAYVTDVPKEQFRNTKIGIDICTFRRESFVLSNLERILQNVAENKGSLLHGHLEVFVSDNGQTLDAKKLNDDIIHIVPNRNVGGAGGFTRGMIEILKANEQDAGITHVLVMDDDIVFSLDVLYRTYLLLCLRRDKYEHAFVGGAMLRLDKPWYQVENGASWNEGRLISHKANLNLETLRACAANELLEYHEYNAWWYCCMPISVVRPDNLPLPLFIRGDDVEYGLRNCRQLMTLNGICVWHEPFESKYSSSTYYYILRNQCIDNSLHCPGYGKKALKDDLRSQVLGELNRYRYKNAALLIRGVRDFLKGIDWLKTTDAEALHQEVIAAGYKSLPIEQTNAKVPLDLSQYGYTLREETPSFKKKLLMRLTNNGHLLPPTRKTTVVSAMYMTAYNAYRVEKVLNYNPNNQTAFVTTRDPAEYHRCIQEMKTCLHEIDAKFDAARDSYRQRHGELQSLDFWEKYLMLKSK